MKNLLSLFTSKKFWVTVTGVFTVVAGKYYGMDQSNIDNLVQLFSVLVGAFAGVDIAKAIKDSTKP